MQANRHKVRIRHFLFNLFVSIIFSLQLASAARADSSTAEAHSWLKKLHHASQHINYDGVFVYMHGDQLDAMRIIHKVDAGKHIERLVSLTGSAREVIRLNRQWGPLMATVSNDGMSDHFSACVRIQ